MLFFLALCTMYRQAGTPRGPVRRRLYGGRAVRNLVGRRARRWGTGGRGPDGPGRIVSK